MLPRTGDASLPRRPAGGVPAGAGATSAAEGGVASAAKSECFRAEGRQPTAGVIEELSGAFASARSALSNFVDLVSLEARRAGLALTWMVVWGLVAAICIIGAWLGLMAALAMWAVFLGLPPIAAVIAVAAINLIAGVVLICVCIGMSRALLFTATRRQVAGHSAVEPPAP